MAFNDLQFSETDARKIQDRLQRVYEEVRRAGGEPGYRLAAADPERLVQLTEAAALTQVAADIDKTGKGNLLYFADDETIEHIGYLYGERGKQLDYGNIGQIHYASSRPSKVTCGIPLKMPTCQGSSFVGAGSSITAHFTPHSMTSW
ncbi:MAG: hypothetical protein Pg6C_18590 [Treponemataceae bacterium]|nr:MAG: hypothetical protein Pg6C_18590 [Treponemataceae bacterium]